MSFKNLKFLQIGILSLVFGVMSLAVSVSAQSNSNTNTARTETTRTEARDDDTDWGWLGLLGLAGLAGLLKKPNQVVVERDDVNRGNNVNRAP